MTSTLLRPLVLLAGGLLPGAPYYAMAFIMFTRAGKYYELIVSGDPAATTACNFPPGVRETAKPAP